jgi:hypothetical protein
VIGGRVVPEEAGGACILLAMEPAFSVSNVLVRGDGLLYNWMPLLIGEGLHL